MKNKDKALSGAGDGLPRPRRANDVEKKQQSRGIQEKGGWGSAGKR